MLDSCSFQSQLFCSEFPPITVKAHAFPSPHPKPGLLVQSVFAHQLTQQDSLRMDAIRKKMQSLKSETDGLYKTIAGFEEATREAVGRADQVNFIFSDFSWY